LIEKQLALSHRQDVAALPSYMRAAVYRMREQRPVGGRATYSQGPSLQYGVGWEPADILEARTLLNMLSRGFTVKLNTESHTVNRFEGFDVAPHVRDHTEPMRAEVRKVSELARREFVAMVKQLSAHYRTTHTRELIVKGNATCIECTFTPLPPLAV
jgi:hypothetical protein